MSIQIQAIQFTAGQQLVDFIDKKMGRLNTYYDKIIDTEVFLSLFPFC